MENRELETLAKRTLDRVAEAGIDTGAAVRVLQQFRSQSDAASVRLDDIIIQYVSQLGGRFRELAGVQAELREMIGSLTAPPLHPAVFLQTETVGGERLAVVAHDTVRRLVTAGPDVRLDDMRAGDTVHLSHELNAILAHSPGGPDLRGEIALVERAAPDGRLVLRHRDAEVVVDCAAAVAAAGVGPGDAVVWDPRLQLAIAPAPPARESRWMLREVEPVARDTLGGLGRHRDRTIDVFVRCIVRPELAARYGVAGFRSLLLVGPPGNGKTTLMRVIAAEIERVTGRRCVVACINGAELESPWVGETQGNIRLLFRQLQQADGPKLLFIDEIEAIGRVRGSAAGHHSDKFLSSWLTALDGVRRQTDLAIVAATNRKDLIDPALLERLSGMELYVPRPGMDAAREILRIHLPEWLPYSPNGRAAAASRESLIELAVTLLYAPNAGNDVAVIRFRDARERTVAARELVSGRVLEQICTAARRAAFHRHDAHGRAGIREADIEAAVHDAVGRLASTLGRHNARSYLDDLPQDVDIVAVHPIHRRARPDRYRGALPDAAPAMGAATATAGRPA